MLTPLGSGSEQAVKRAGIGLIRGGGVCEGRIDDVGGGIERIESESPARLTARAVPIMILLAVPAGAEYQGMRALLPVEAVDRVQQRIKRGDRKSRIDIAVQAGQIIRPVLAIQVWQIDTERLGVKDAKLIHVAGVELVNERGAQHGVDSESGDP